MRVRLRCVAEMLRVNTTLTSLDLRINEIGDAGAAALGEALRVNGALTSLSLVGNNISAADEAALLAALAAR